MKMNMQINKVTAAKTKQYDAVIIGAGHNGLVCAAYLAKAGKSVLLLEANERIGGGSITREFAPGFRVSALAHLLYGMPDSIIKDLQLAEHGLEFCATQMPSYALSMNTAPVRIDTKSLQGTASKADKEKYALFVKQMDSFSRVLTMMFDMTPPRIVPQSLRERFDFLRLGLKVRLLGKKSMRELLRIAGMNAFDLIEEKFESDVLKGALAFDAVIGAEYGPRSPGTVLNYLYRWASLRNAGRLGIAQPKDGMGAVTGALLRAAEAYSAELRTNALVKRILVKNDRACGVILNTGEIISANCVISNADPKATYLKLLGPSHLDTGFVRRVDHVRSRGLVAKFHVALKALPTFNHLAATELGARLIIAPSAHYVESAFNPSKYREMPEHPVLEITIPTVNDPGLASNGQHILSVLVQFVPYELPEDPETVRQQFSKRLLAILEQFAPGIESLVVATELLLPRDIESEFHVHGGHWHHGALALDQFFFTRPIPGSAQYKTPVEGLFLCGAGCHPGGGVMGIAGRNAAQVVLGSRLPAQGSLENDQVVTYAEFNTATPSTPGKGGQ